MPSVHRFLVQLPVLALLVCSCVTPASAERPALSLIDLDLAFLGPAAQPNLATDPKSQSFILSWQARLDDGCAALRVAELDRAGVLGPVHEVARGCNWFVNWADFPSLVVADNGDWLTFWLQKTGADTYAYEIRSVRSTDRGQNWSDPLVVHDDGTPTEHGFVAMAPAGADRVKLLWLDGREMADDVATAAAGHSEHHGHEGRMSVRSAVLSRSGIVPGSATELDDQACSCCGTDLQRLPGTRGHLALYRDRSDAEIRDIRIARHNGRGWKQGALVHDDQWEIAACPVNGPALAVSEKGELAVWSTMPDAHGLSVRMRLLGGAAGFQTLEHGTAVLGRVDSAAWADGWLVSWLGAKTGENGSSVLRLAVLDDSLQRQQVLDVRRLSGNRNIGMPKLASVDGVAMLVWTEVMEAVGDKNQARAPTQLRGVRLQSDQAPTETDQSALSD